MQVNALHFTECCKIKLCNSPTVVDDGNSGVTRPNSVHFNDGLNEVNDELPVVASDRVIVTYTTRVVNHERNVSNTRCNDNKIIRPIYFVSTA